MDAKVVMALIKISPKKISTKELKRESGFTLFEIMIVLGILGAILAVGLPRFNARRTNVKTVSHDVALITREIRNQARIKGRTYRLVFHMTKNPKEAESYWIESAEGAVMPPSKETLERQKSPFEADKPKAPTFQKDDRILKKDRELPPEVFIGSIETESAEEPVIDGDGFVYFSPEGLVQKSAIQITNRKGSTWTLIINPLTGHADVVEKAIALKDASRE